MAQQREQSKRNKQLIVGNFKGMETVIDSSALGLDVADMARNVSWDTDGGISRREGTKKVYDNGQEEINFFIKRKVGMVDATHVAGIGNNPTLSKGRLLPTRTIPLKGDKGEVKGAKTFGVISPIPTWQENPKNTYKAFLKDDQYQKQTSAAVDNGNVFWDANKKPITMFKNLISQIDNAGGLINAIYYKSKYEKEYTFSNDEDNFVDYSNTIGVHGQPDPNHERHGRVSAEAQDDVVWMGFEPKVDIPWSVVHNTRINKVVVATPGEHWSIGYFEDERTTDINHNVMSGFPGSYKLANIGAKWCLTYINSMQDPTTTRYNIVKKLYKANRDKDPEQIDFGEDVNHSLMSHTIAPDGSIIALFYKEGSDFRSSDMKLFKLNADGSKNSAFTKDVASIEQLYNTIDDGFKRNIISIFTRGESSSYSINFSVLHIIGKADVEELYEPPTSQTYHTFEIENLDTTPTYKPITEARFESGLIYGVRPMESWHPEAIYDEFADRVIFMNNPKYSFVNDYVPRVLEIPADTKIFSIGSDPIFVANGFANSIPDQITILDENKNRIVEVTKEPSGNLLLTDMTEINKHTGIKYIVTKDNVNKLNNIQVYEGQEDAASTNNQIKNTIKNGNKIIGKLLDVSIVISKEGTLSALGEGDKKFDIYNGAHKSKSFKLQNIENFKTEDISWTYINDSIIISTSEDAFVVTAIEVTPGEMGIYINTIFDLADKISYSQAIESGLNRLANNPLDLVRTEEELVGATEFRDIIITELDKPDHITLSIAPKKDYRINPQVFVPNKDTYTKAYTWKLFKLGKTDAQWTEVSGGIEGDANHPTLKALAVETEYRIQCDATVTKHGGSSETFSKSLTFNIDGKSVALVNNGNTIYNEIKKCKYVTTLDGRLVFYGNGTRQIYTSEIESPFYFTASEIAVADAFGKSEDIVSINSFKDTHIIFTNTTMMSMTRVYPDKAESFWSVLALDGVIGTVGHNAVSPIENSLAFVSDEGVYIIGQISVAERRVQLIPIATPIQDVVSTFGGNGKRMSNINTANLEKRLFISFPDKRYMAVYDYNASENIASGKWAIWDNVIPKQMEVDDFNLYFTNDGIIDDKTTSLHNSKLYVKNKRVYLDVHELSGDETYFADDGEIYDFEYISKNSALSEPMAYKKIKRISITADNWIKDDAKYDVKTTVDYQPDWNEKVENFIYKNPNLNKSGFLKLGKTMTTWRKSENIKTITNMKAKKGTVLNISIKNHSKGPISIKRIYIEYIHSNIRRFKSNSK